MFYDIVTEIKPKWYQFRWKLSNLFLWIAKKIYRENPDVWAFFSKITMDKMITGKSFVRVDPKEIYKNKRR